MSAALSPVLPYIELLTAHVQTFMLLYVPFFPVSLL